MKCFTLAGFLVTLAVASPSFAQEIVAAAPVGGAAPAVVKADIPDHVLQPILWRVSGNGLSAPSYLFGTIHLADERVVRMHPLARAAFDRSASLHTEIAMDPRSESGTSKAVLRRDGKKLDADIGPELAQKLKAELKRVNPAMTSAPFQPLKTWVVAIALPTLENQLQAGQPLDAQLWKDAEQSGKRCGTLETMEEHMAGLDTLTAGEQVLLLKVNLGKMAKPQAEARSADKSKAIAFYLQGDAPGVAALSREASSPDVTAEEKALDVKVEKRLMSDRNPGMVAAMVKELKAHPAESHFFAIGTAHCVGVDNVVDLLQKAGYAVERVQAPEK